MRFDVLAKRLADAKVGTIGKDIFAHHMPADCKKGVLLRAPLGGISIDHYLPGYYKTEIQVIVRDTAYDSGASVAEKVSAALSLQSPTTFKAGSPLKDVMQLNLFLPLSLPIHYPRSDGNGLEWSINFQAVYVLL